MHWLIDLALAFVLLGLSEAVVKPIAKRLVQRRLLVAAPLVFEHLDPLMPGLLRYCSGAEVEGVVRRQLEAITGESWATDDLGPLFALFDPRAAADRTQALLADGQLGNAELAGGNAGNSKTGGSWPADSCRSWIDTPQATRLEP